MPKKKHLSPSTSSDFDIAKTISPRRKTSLASDIDGLASEQLAHFSIDPETEVGQALHSLASSIYKANIDLNHLWQASVQQLSKLDRKDRIAYFNAKKFLCFQLAKLLDTLQNPFRSTYQSIVPEQSSRIAKGPYPIFDNVTAIFSATPVITRTATYLYACTEWIDDAFQGKETLLEVYSRLLNPTSISLANHIVDLECGPLSVEYTAWNFNSGMAAIDAILSHLLGYQDIIICSRNVYGGTYQLLADWFGKPSNLDIAVHWFDGYDVNAFESALEEVKEKYGERLASGKKIYCYMESPCNPHGYVLDVASISKRAHKEDILVLLDTTVATPFLYRPLMRDNPAERPDFVIHSYTKDITGTGVTTAGVVIGANERMFVPKNETVKKKNHQGNEIEYRWNDTLFWNVYYVKGAFLDSEKAFEVINGSRTLELRMIKKTINTIALARFFNSHPEVSVNCNALEENENRRLKDQYMYLGLPAPLFTIDMEKSSIGRDAFTRFFDCLEPIFGHMVSLGQSNTMILCPALTSHSEMSPERLKEAGITLTTIRVSVGDEDARSLMGHFIRTAELVFDPISPGFSSQFLSFEEMDRLYREIYLDVHEKWIDAQAKTSEVVS
ncbi:MAG: PLP-dependent transferase [Gammaproteobacteria bacterium]|nr:PLP-dependent transferase [Gammaproteobacteria bacterium]MDH5694431.1 PLP-dependent transferase [Gammaproteobacteria bacterium]